MQIESLKSFCDLAECKSFTRTAQINDVTESAISQTLGALERRFESLLLERGKNFRLTAEGEVIYDYSKRILQTCAALQSAMQAIQGILAGDIHVAAVSSIGLYDLPPYVKRFRKDYPAVNVQVQYGRANQIYEDVLGNTVDLGLVAFPERHTKLEIAPFRRDPLVLACPPQHPLAKLKTVKFKDLSGQKFVGFAPDMPTRKAVDRMLQDRGVEIGHVIEFDTIEMAKKAVAIGAGVAILPAATIRGEVTDKTLVAVRLEGNCFRPLAAIYRKAKVLSPAMKKFIERLKTSF